MTPLNYIQARAIERATEAGINELISVADQETSTSYYGKMRYKAVALLVLHWFALRDRDSGASASGNLVSDKEGDLARSYSVAPKIMAENPDLSQTTWGVELLQLQSSYFAPPITRRASW